jgi:hypothetical protein
MVLFSLLHSQWRECCPGESPLLHIAFVRIAVHPLLSRQTPLTFAFLLFSPNLSDLHCDCLLREACPTRVPSPVRPSSVVVVFPRGRGGFSAIRESFNVQIIMMLYCDSFGWRLFTVYMNPFSRSFAQSVVYTCTTTLL